jgi:hypothetical protein
VVDLWRVEVGPLSGGLVLVGRYAHGHSRAKYVAQGNKRREGELGRVCVERSNVGIRITTLLEDVFIGGCWLGSVAFRGG